MKFDKQFLAQNSENMMWLGRQILFITAETEILKELKKSSNAIMKILWGFYNSTWWKYPYRENFLELL